MWILNNVYASTIIFFFIQHFPWRKRFVYSLTPRLLPRLQNYPAVVLFIEGDQEEELELAEGVLLPVAQQVAKTRSSALYDLLFFIAPDVRTYHNRIYCCKPLRLIQTNFNSVQFCFTGRYVGHFKTFHKTDRRYGPVVNVDRYTDGEDFRHGVWDTYNRKIYNEFCSGIFRRDDEVFTDTLIYMTLMSRQLFCVVK